MIVVDTSVFVAAFREGEPRYSDAIRFVELIEHGAIPVSIPETVLIEIVAAIRRRTKSNDLAAIVRRRMSQWSMVTIVPLTQGLVDQSLDLASTVGLRGMDTVVLATAIEQHLPLVTLDKQLGQLALPFVPVLEIREVLDAK